MSGVQSEGTVQAPPDRLRLARVVHLGNYMHMLVAHIVAPVPEWIFPYYVADGPTFDHRDRAPREGL